MAGRYITALAALTLVLGACHQAPAEKAAAETGSATPAPASPEAEAEPPTTFLCDNNLTVTAQYGPADSGDRLTLSVAGKAYDLTAVPSASGGKYMTDTGMSAGKSLVWWGKGDEAMLIEAPVGNDDEAAATTVNCKAQ